MKKEEEFDENAIYTPFPEDYVDDHWKFHGHDDLDIKPNFEVYEKPDDIDMGRRKQIMEEQIKKILFEEPANKKRNMTTKEFERSKVRRKMANKSKNRNRGR